MYELFTEHLERLQAATSGRYTLANIPEWIIRNTKLKGETWSFKDHEYQLQILLDPSRDKVIRKCAQVGITELSLREVLAILRILPGITIIYTMPTANSAEKLVKTRVDLIIAESKDLSFAVSSDVNSTEIKQFDTSFAYFNGTFGQNQAISVPADMVVHDELDFSNQSVLTTYESRLKHSSYKLRRAFSTPTLPKHGICAKFENSRRHFNFCKCNHCNEWFYPDYYGQVRIPGWAEPLDKVTAENLHTLRWREAALFCPKCHKQPSLQPKHRNWVQENPGDMHEAAGYAISPFDAPNVVTPSGLVEESTKYERQADFINFALGLPYEDARETLTESLLRSLYTPGEAGNYAGLCFGADMGLTCHIMIGRQDLAGNLIVVHAERCELADFERRKQVLCSQYRVLISVMDAFPHTEIVIRLQHSDPNLYGSVFHESDNLAIFSVKDAPEIAEKGKLPIRQAKVNRNLALDELASRLLARKVLFLRNAEEDLVIAHILDLKRTQEADRKGQIKHVWVKSPRGADHYMFALLYLYTASFLRGMASAAYTYQPPVSSFRLKNV